MVVSGDDVWKLLKLPFHPLLMFTNVNAFRFHSQILICLSSALFSQMERIQEIIPRNCNFIPPLVSSDYFSIDEDGNDLFYVTCRVGGNLQKEEIISCKNIQVSYRDFKVNKSSMPDNFKHHTISAQKRLNAAKAKEKRRKIDLRLSKGEKNGGIKCKSPVGKHRNRKRFLPSACVKWEPTLSPIEEIYDEEGMLCYDFSQLARIINK